MALRAVSARFGASGYAAQEHLPRQGRFSIENGPITIARFDMLNGVYSLFSGQGRGIDGPPKGKLCMVGSGLLGGLGREDYLWPLYPSCGGRIRKLQPDFKRGLQVFGRRKRRPHAAG